ncbi:hypothetical protein ACS0TY_028039 [Phlomoides rotata]
MASPEDVGYDVLDLGTVEGSTRERGSSYCLVGKLCTSRLFNVFALMDVMVRAFKTHTKVVVREWGKNLLIFTFTNERDWVVRNQPWHFDGHLFAVKPLMGSEQPSSVTVSKGSFWARAFDIPIMCQTEATLISIAHQLRELKVFEPPDGFNLSSYLWFKVAVDITKPLLRGLKLRFNGDALWVPIKYESLPFYCFCCGVIGHNFKFGESYDRNECPEPVEMDFGPFLRASPMKKGRGPKVENKFYVPDGVGVTRQLVHNITKRTHDTPLCQISQALSGISTVLCEPSSTSKSCSFPSLDSKLSLNEPSSIQSSDISGRYHPSTSLVVSVIQGVGTTLVVGSWASLLLFLMGVRWGEGFWNGVSQPY